MGAGPLSFLRVTPHRSRVKAVSHAGNVRVMTDQKNTGYTVFTQRMPNPLLHHVDRYAATAGISRAGAINVLMAQFFGIVPAAGIVDPEATR